MKTIATFAFWLFGLYKDHCFPTASGSQTQASGPVDANEHITDLARNELNCFE